MKIPRRFQLLGRTITVEITGEPFIEKDGSCGFASYRLNQIQLRPSTSDCPRSNEMIEQTFCHELLHFITYYAGAAYSGKAEHMHKDEDFIDMMAGLLHQALTTMEFDEKSTQKSETKKK